LPKNEETLKKVVIEIVTEYQNDTFEEWTMYYGSLIEPFENDEEFKERTVHDLVARILIKNGIVSFADYYTFIWTFPNSYKEIKLDEGQTFFDKLLAEKNIKLEIV
jgi:predicted transcriptional regulator